MKGDSLLSNISNISVQIRHQPGDGSQFFKLYANNHDPNEKQIKFQELLPEQQYQQNSLLDQIIRVKDCDNAIMSNNWMVCKQPGLSEEEDNSYSNKQVISKQTNTHKICKKKGSRIHRAQDNNQKSMTKADRRLKNQTKNIPKNFGKAIITFIEQQIDKFMQLAGLNNQNYGELLQNLSNKKKTINTIADLRSLWVDESSSKSIRMLSNLFLRKHSLHYIFNSRVCNYSSHIKYRQRLCQAMRYPGNFRHIKQY